MDRDLGNLLPGVPQANQGTDRAGNTDEAVVEVDVAQTGEGDDHVAEIGGELEARGGALTGRS